MRDGWLRKMVGEGRTRLREQLGCGGRMVGREGER